MEVRCGSCSKLFRVADEKITGSGIRFVCTGCGEYVRITRDDFDQYQQSRAGGPAPYQMPEPGPLEAPPARDTAEPGSQATDFVIEPTSLDLGGASGAEQQTDQNVPGLEHTSFLDQGGGMESDQRLDLEDPILSAQASAEPDTGLPSEQPGFAEETPSPLAAFQAPSKEKPTLETEAGVNPFASGAAAGAIGGLGCALLAVAAQLTEFNVLAPITSALMIQKPADTPFLYGIARTVTGFLGLGILLGILLAIMQARGRRMFSFCGLVFSAIIGALIGAGQGFAVAAGFERVVQAVGAGVGALWWGVKAFLVGMVVVIIRRTMMSSNQESFSASLSGGQVMGLILSIALIGAAAYGEVMNTSELRVSMQGAAVLVKDMALPPENLKVADPQGYMDSDKDLVITGVVENTGETSKQTWYLVADIYDAKGTVLYQAKMLNGRQLYSSRERDILSKRGKGVQDGKKGHLLGRRNAIPPKGMIKFKIRVIDPPTGITSFTVTPKPLDPVETIKDMAGRFMKKK